jgi:hypothetical protein
LLHFHKRNEDSRASSTSSQYTCEYDNEKNEVNIIEIQFFILNYDHSKFESFGKIIDSKLMLKVEEVDYLNELGLIKLNGITESNLFNILISQKGLYNKAIYGYFRRSGSIICW